MSAYYNEIDLYAAQWLRNLIKAGHIADGVVDTRSISEVEPNDLHDFTQCHFFAGIGVWSLALRLAGWPDDRPVWSGSCPCQPFSSAGRSGGFTDERHLWPHWHHLIRECQPAVIFGEQVASKATEPWIDLVQTDLEGLGYATGGVPFPSAGVGSPHIRDRYFWVGYAHHHQGLEGHPRDGSKTRRQDQNRPVTTASISCGLGHAQGERRGEARQFGPGPAQRFADAGTANSRLAHADCRKQRPHTRPEPGDVDVSQEWNEGATEASGLCGDMRPGPVNGFWADADWLLCRDGKWRPVEPGTFPLADGAASRVGRLRAYGNAINAEAAKTFIAAFMEARP